MASAEPREVGVTILSKEKGARQAYRTKATARGVAALDEAGKAYMIKYSALLTESKQLIPGKDKKLNLLRVRVCRLAMDRQISLQDAFEEIWPHEEVKVSSLKRRATRPRALKQIEKGAPQELPVWARRLNNPSALSVAEIAIGLKRVKEWVSSHRREGRSCLLGQRILEKLSRESIRRKCRTGYVRIVQGGSPGLGKHKS